MEDNFNIVVWQVTVGVEKRKETNKEKEKYKKTKKEPMIIKKKVF